MTDPEFADHTYVEPIEPEYIEKILVKEREEGHPIDAVLATLGGQTALNAAVQLDRQGILDKYGIELIGADIDAIERGEDRQKFKDIVASIGGESANSGSVMMVAGLEFTSVTRRPSSLSTRQAWVPE